MSERRPRKILPAIVLLVMSAVILLERWHTYEEPLIRDIAGYAVLSHEMLHGRKLYSDLWERKPPLVFAIFAAAECVTGYGRGEIYLVNVVAAIGTMVFIYQAGGIFAAGLWTLLCGDIWVEGNQPNAEALVNLFIAGGFAILVRNTTTHRRWRYALAGLMFTAATLCKHHVIVICAFLLAADWIRNWRKRRDGVRAEALNTFIATTVIGVIWVAVFGYFFYVRRFADFYSALFRQNAAYAGSLLENLAAAFEPRHLLVLSMVWSIPPLILLMLWIISGANNRPHRPWFMVVVYMISAWIAVSLPGYFWGHYYQLLLPPLCIAGGWAASALTGLNQRWPSLIRYILLSTLFVITVCWESTFYRLSPTDWAREKYTIDDVPEEKAVGLMLRKVLLANESVWELGEENEIYFESRKSPPSGMIYLTPLEAGPERAAYSARMLADLKRTNPDLVIVDNRHKGQLPSDSEILPWVRANYLPDQAKLSRGYYLMFVRRGSDLARRLAIEF